MTYKQYLEIKSYQDSNELNDEQLQVKMIEIIFNLTSEQVRNLKPNDLISKIDIIGKLFNSNKTLINKIKVDGIEYGFCPDFSKITTGELIDLDTLLKDDNWLGICSILYRKITSSNYWGYTIEPYDGNIDRFTDLDFNIVIGLMNFFYLSYNHLNRCSLLFTK